MDNPLSQKTRGWIYLCGIITGIVLTGIGAALALYGLEKEVALVSIVSSTLTTLVSTIARAYLGSSEGGSTAVQKRCKHEEV